MIKNAPCHSTAGGDFVTMERSLSLKFKSCAQDNRMRFETGQNWEARVGKPAILGWLIKINLGHLGKSEWEEELSTAVMRQFGRD